MAVQIGCSYVWAERDIYETTELNPLDKKLVNSTYGHCSKSTGRKTGKNTSVHWLADVCVICTL